MRLLRKSWPVLAEELGTTPQLDAVIHRNGSIWADGSPLALVVDDEPLVRQLVCSVLARSGWRTVEATDGVAALGLSLDGRVDLLITDYEMPAMTGTEVASEFRQRMPDLPVLMISGVAAVAAVAMHRRYSFLRKPFELDELMSLVKTLTDQQIDGSAAEQETEIEANEAGGITQ